MSQSEASTTATSLSLNAYLSDRIRREGPITFHEWMSEALYNDPAGYYMRPGATIWGRAGDYRTSPETSELFAATFARFFADLYQPLGEPDRFHIMECGAGDGSFAEAVLHSLHSFFPDVYSAMTYLVVEVGFNRHSDIRQRLARFATKVEIISYGNLCELNPGIVFSNELLDAFPVHLITKRNGELLELYVGLNASGAFDWVTGPLSTGRLRDMYQENGIEIETDQIVELSSQIA